MADLPNLLVVGCPSPQTCRLNATAAASYPGMEIANAEPVP